MYCVCVVRARQSDRHARFDGGPVVPASGISHAVEPYRGTRDPTKYDKLNVPLKPYGIDR